MSGLSQGEVWHTSEGLTIPIPELEDQHLLNILDFLDRRAGGLKEAFVWRGYLNGPQPRGDMAQDAFEDEFMRLLAEPAHRWLHRQPQWLALHGEAEKRGLIEVVFKVAQPDPDPAEPLQPLCRCDEEFAECEVHVKCDEGCKALLEPVRKRELRAAVAHWRRHEFLRGCSHGR